MRAPAAVIAILLAGSLVFSQAGAEERIATDADGWHTWQIEAGGPVITWCCFSSRARGHSDSGCNLDGRSISLSNHGHGYGHGDGHGDGDCSAAAGPVQVYAQIREGKPEKIRVLSSACPVTTETEMTDHGSVTIEQNIAWFRTVIENPRLDIDIRQEALFALVQTETDAAFDYIDTLLAVN